MSRIETAFRAPLVSFAEKGKRVELGARRNTGGLVG